MMDLYACVRPVQYFTGVPSPVKHPELVDMVIFRENTEDIYAGIEYKAGTPEVKKVIEFLQKEMKVNKIRFPETSAIGVKPVSEEGSKRLIRAAIRYAIANNRKSVTLVHKGNIMKYTEADFVNGAMNLPNKNLVQSSSTADRGANCQTALSLKMSLQMRSYNKFSRALLNMM